MKRFYLPDRDLSVAGRMWEMGGCQALGLWFAHNRELCNSDYGALVRAVRKYLGDDTDYSDDADERRPREVQRGGEGT